MKRELTENERSMIVQALVDKMSGDGKVAKANRLAGTDSTCVRMADAFARQVIQCEALIGTIESTESIVIEE